MTTDQLNGTRLLSELLVRMVKDSYAENPLLADQARLWLNLPSFDGMASVDRACAQLAAAQRAVMSPTEAKQDVYRQPAEWRSWSLEACQEPQQLDELEKAIERLIARCHQTLLSTPETSGLGNAHGHSLDDDDYSPPSDHSPSF